MDTTTLLQFDILDLRELVRRLLSLPDGACFIGEQSGVVDGQPFVFLKEMGDSDYGPPRLIQNDDDTETVTQPKMVEVDIEAVGPKAAILMRKLHVLLKSSPSKEFARMHHFAFQDFKRPFNVGGLMGAGFEQRYRLTAVISYVHKIRIEQAYIREVDISVYNDKHPEDVRNVIVKVD